MPNQKHEDQTDSNPKQALSEAGTKENDGHQSSGKGKVVVVIFTSDGGVHMNQVETDEIPSLNLGDKAGRIVGSLTLPSVPKRFEVLLEKWGKTKTVTQKKEEVHHD